MSTLSNATPATSSTSQPTPGTSRLGQAKKSKLTQPVRLFFYGTEGIGKTSLGAAAPEPIFFDIEGGSGHLDTVRYPFSDDSFVPASYADILRGINDLTVNSHNFQTLVIDTVDKMEGLVWQHVCSIHSKQGKSYSSVEDFGYGKGYVLALDVWKEFVHALDRLRQTRHMTIILLGHAQIKTFKSPDTDDFDRYSPRLHDKAGGLLKEWSDVVGFATFEMTTTSEDGKKAKGVSTGVRVLKLEREAAFDAKTRYPMPKEIEMSPEDPWAPFAKAISEARNPSPQILMELITAELLRIGDAELVKKVTAASIKANAAGDVTSLSKYLATLKSR